MDSSTETTLGAPPIAGPTNLASRAREAVAWATGLQFLRDVVQFGLTLALVRILPVEAYGQFGVITTLLTFFTYYSFREFLGHTLQVRSDGDPHYQDQFTAGAVIQGVIVVGANVAAFVLRGLPDYAPIAPLLHVMSLLFVIDLPAEFRVRMLERQLDWRRLRVLQGLGFLAAGALSLAMALAGGGAWALLIPMLVAPLPFVYDLFFVDRWRPTWAFDWSRYRAAWQFGLTRMVTLTFIAIATLTESLTLASALGFAMLGIFGRALGLAQLLCARLSSLLAIAIYPVLTRVPKSSDAFRRAASLYLRAVTWAVVPAAVLATLLADPIVRALYGSKWVEAIPFVPWAMAGAAVAAVAQTAYTLLLANGQQRACVIADAWKMVGTVAALAIALPAGPATYLMAICAMQVVTLLVASTSLWRSRALAGTAVAGVVAPPLVSAALATVSLIAWRWAAATAVDPVVVHVGAAATFGVTYLAALRLLFGTPLGELVAELPQSRRIGRALGLA